jgi:soluble lytic murein transglycosylase-like protein
MSTWAIIFIVLLVAYVILSGWLLKTHDLKGWGKPAVIFDGSPPYGRAILEAYYETGTPEDLLTRLLLSESGMDPKATSGKNIDGSTDHGIAQLNGRYLEYFAKMYGGGKLDPYDPLQAIPCAARYLADLHRLFGCWACAVAAYKMGPGTVQNAARGKGRIDSWLAISGPHECGKGD